MSKFYTNPQKAIYEVISGEPFGEEIVADSVDAALEKHVPFVTQDGNLVHVQVGSVEHPMLPEHHIAWVELESEQGTQRKMLDPTGEPVVSFALVPGDTLRTVYAYCNIHGLWKVDMV